MVGQNGEFKIEGADGTSIEGRRRHLQMPTTECLSRLFFESAFGRDVPNLTPTTHMI